MKKVIKLLSVSFAFILSLLLFVSCGGDVKVLDNYLLEIDGNVVEADFTLASKLDFGGKTYDLTWESNKANVTIEKKDDEFLAKVTRPEDAEVIVTLTVKRGSESKDFTVRVKPLTSYDFASKYNFAQFRKEVTEDFNLETSTTLAGKTATITWAVKEGSEEYISIVNNKVVIVPQTAAVKAYLNATFTYGGKTTVKTYYVLPTLPKTHEEEINALYSKAGITTDMEGYVVAIGTAYDEGYKNATFYLKDKDSDAGFYFYRSSNKDIENGKKLEVGSYVKVTGFTNTDYNGLWETSSGGSFVVDTTVEKKDMSTEVYKLDNDLLGEVYSTRFHESTMVSLTNWKVKSVNSTLAEKAPTTVLVLTKNNVDVNVNISKYFGGAFTYGASDPVVTAMLTKVATLHENDWVSVKGVLGRSLTATTEGNGFCIQPLSADDIAVGTEDTATSWDGAKVGALQKTHMQALETAGAYKDGVAQIVRTAKTFTLAGTDGVTVECSIPFSRAVVKGENGAFTVTPGAEEEATIIATYTCGEYVTKAYYTIATKAAASATVTFNSNGGSAVEAQTVTTGNKATEPTAPTKDGKSFGGWYKEEALTNRFDFANEVIEGSITLYAKWNDVVVKETTISHENMPTAYPSEATALTDLANFSAVCVACYDKKDPYTIQFNGKPDQSKNRVRGYIYNTEALSYDITEVVVQAHANKYPTDVAGRIQVEVSETADFTNSVKLTGSYDATTLKVTYSVESGSYKYVKISRYDDGTTYAVNVVSILVK